MPAVAALSDAGGTLAINLASGSAAECYNGGPFRTYMAGNPVGTAAPVITSASSATYLAGASVNFTVSATAAPALPALSVSGTLPSGVTFTDNGDGTGTFAGTATTAGVFALTITVANDVSPDAMQDSP